MQLDQKMLHHLLNMNDEQLGVLSGQLAQEAGIDPAQLGLHPEQLASVRQALGNATDEDIAKLNGVYQEYRKHRRQN